MTHAKALAVTEETVAAALQELDWPALPLDRCPRQGDLAVICFPAAKQLRQLPEALATELATALAGRGLRATADGDGTLLDDPTRRIRMNPREVELGNRLLPRALRPQISEPIGPPFSPTGPDE